MLKPIKFPEIYERKSKERTSEEIWKDLNDRFSRPASEPLYRTVPSTPLAPPPPDPPAPEPPPVRPVVRAKVVRRKVPGRPPGPDIKRKPLSEADIRKAECSHAGHWYVIGKSKTEGRVRRRCELCRLEQTVDAVAACGDEYRPERKASEGKKAAGSESAPAKRRVASR